MRVPRAALRRCTHARVLVVFLSFLRPLGPPPSSSGLGAVLMVALRPLRAPVGASHRAAMLFLRRAVQVSRCGCHPRTFVPVCSRVWDSPPEGQRTSHSATPECVFGDLNESTAIDSNALESIAMQWEVQRSGGDGRRRGGDWRERRRRGDTQAQYGRRRGGDGRERRHWGDSQAQFLETGARISKCKH